MPPSFLGGCWKWLGLSPRKSKKRGGGAKKTAKRKTVCFPGDADVIKEDGSKVPISDIRVGDRVVGADQAVSTVVFVPHEPNFDQHTFVRLTLSEGRSIRLTESHFIPVRRSGTEIVIRAKDVLIGDFVESLQPNREWMEIIGYDPEVVSEGVYSFSTDEEFICIDGFRLSPYGGQLFSHSVFHRLFSLFRFSYSWVPALNRSPQVAKAWLWSENFITGMVSN
jgi:Hint module